VFNVILTGQIKNYKYFKNNIKVFSKLKKNKEIYQLILSTWENEIDKFKNLRKLLIEANFKIIESKLSSINIKTSYNYQTITLKNGLDKIKNNGLMIFKSRPDLVIKSENLLKIANLDYQIIEKKNNIFEKKIWVHWFEITKPFYICDECFYASYNDIKKLCRNDNEYEKKYITDHGKTHIIRFINPFLKNYPSLINYLKYLSISGYETNKRFKILEKLKSNKVYLEFIYLYYFFIYTYFIVGLEDKKNNYIYFRKWSNCNIKLNNNLLLNFNKKYSWDRSLGQIYSYKNIDNASLIKKDKFQNALNNSFSKIDLYGIEKLFYFCKEVFEHASKRSKFKKKIDKLFYLLFN
jgi:hypothetical protein